MYKARGTDPRVALLFFCRRAPTIRRAKLPQPSLSPREAHLPPLVVRRTGAAAPKREFRGSISERAALVLQGAYQ